jgi:hypothetical protein
MIGDGSSHNAAADDHHIGPLGQGLVLAHATPGLICCAGN